MRRYRSIKLILALIICFSMNTRAQKEESSSFYLSESGERIDLQTDRSIYAVNENILFSAFYQIKIVPDSVMFSTVIYTELIRWNGGKIAHSKNLIKKGNANGSIKIPGDLESGVYYLRAYTKWMRNYSPYSYEYIPIKIVNPGTRKTEVGPFGTEVNFRSTGEHLEKSNDGFSILGLKESYKRRELIEFEVKYSDANPSGNYSLSVVRSGSLIPEQSSNNFIENVREENPQFEFYPEIRGLSLSGKVRDEETKDPIQGAKINLSSTKTPFYHASATSDSSGNFLFTFPQIEGTYEFNLSDEQMNSSSTELLIDSDFCNYPVRLPFFHFNINEQELQLAKDLVINSQLSEKFSEAEYLTPINEKKYSFYGRSTRTIYEKDFIELESIGEFLFELVYEVSIRHNYGEPKCFMTGQSTLGSYPALVLIDNIPVSDIRELLKVVCRRIDRIEIVNRPYIVGDYMYSGILSFYSEGHDMAGLKPDKNSSFFEMSLLDFNDFSFPEYNEVNKSVSRIPDRRNTLFWNPEIEIAQDKAVKICFYTSDATGQYSVILRKYMEAEGSGVYFEKKFMVE